jgi:excisionase family DNA binding protein
VDDLLTTKQLQDLLQIDRVTIYRMLGDGRLRGFKVGGQWRFSRREIENWLQEQQHRIDGTDALPPIGESVVPSPDALPLSCVQAIQAVCAEALDVAVVATDVRGTPLSEVSNSCDFCSLILSTGEGQRRCSESWRQSSSGRVYPCHAGLNCVSAPITVGGQIVATTTCCQFTIKWVGGNDRAARVDPASLAAELGLSEAGLQAALPGVREIPEEQLPRVSRLLQRMGATFSEIGEERLNLLERLQHIAEMSQL